MKPFAYPVTALVDFLEPDVVPVASDSTQAALLAEEILLQGGRVIVPAFDDRARVADPEVVENRVQLLEVMILLNTDETLVIVQLEVPVQRKKRLRESE